MLIIHTIVEGPANNDLSRVFSHTFELKSSSLGSKSVSKSINKFVQHLLNQQAGSLTHKPQKIAREKNKVEIWSNWQQISRHW